MMIHSKVAFTNSLRPDQLPANSFPHLPNDHTKSEHKPTDTKPKTRITHQPIRSHTLEKPIESPCKGRRFEANRGAKRPSLKRKQKDSYFSVLEKLKNPNSRSREKGVSMLHGISSDLGLEVRRGTSQLNIYERGDKYGESKQSSGESMKNLYKRPISLQKERQNILGSSLQDLERFNDYLERYSQNLRDTVEESRLASYFEGDSCNRESLYGRSPGKQRKSSLNVLKQRFSVLSRGSGKRTRRHKERRQNNGKSPKFIQINNFFGNQFEDFEALESQIYSKSGLEKENLINWAELSYDMSRRSVQGIYEKEDSKNQLKSFRDIKIAGLRGSEKRMSSFHKKGLESRSEISGDGGETRGQKVYYKSQRVRKRGKGLGVNRKDKEMRASKSRNGRRYRTGVEYAGEVSRSRSEFGKDSRSFGNLKEASQAKRAKNEIESLLEPHKRIRKSKGNRGKRQFRRGKSKKIEIRMGGKKLGILKINPSRPEEIDFIKEVSKNKSKIVPECSKAKANKMQKKSKEISNPVNCSNESDRESCFEKDGSEMGTRLEFHKDCEGKMRSVLKRNTRLSLASRKQKLVHLMKIGSSFCEGRERGKMLRDYQNLRKRDASILSLNARNSKGSFENHCSFDIRGGCGVGKDVSLKGMCLSRKKEKETENNRKRKRKKEAMAGKGKVKMRDLVKDPARFVRETLKKRRYLSKKYTKRFVNKPSKNLKKIALTIDPSKAKDDSILQRTPVRSKMKEEEPKSCNLIHDRHYFRKTLRSPVYKDGKSLGSPVHSHLNPYRRPRKNLFGSDLSLLSEGQSAVMGNPDLERSFAVAKSVMWSGASSANKKLRERSNSKSISALKREHEIRSISVKRSIQKKTLFGELVKRNGRVEEKGKGKGKRRRLAIKGKIVCSSIDDSVSLEAEERKMAGGGDQKEGIGTEDLADMKSMIQKDKIASDQHINKAGKVDIQSKIDKEHKTGSKDGNRKKNVIESSLKEQNGLATATTTANNRDHKPYKTKKVSKPGGDKQRKAKRELKKINTNSQFCSLAKHFQKGKQALKSKSKFKSKSKSVLHKRKITFGKNLSKRCWSGIPNSSLNSLKDKVARSLENVSRKTERSLARAKQAKIKRRLLGKSKRSSRDLEKTINSLSKMQHSVKTGDGCKSRVRGVFFYFGSNSGRKAAHTRTHGPMELKELFESEGVMNREFLIKARMMAMSQRNLDKPSLISTKDEGVSGLDLGKYNSKRHRRTSPFMGMITPKGRGNFKTLGRCRTQNDEFSSKRNLVIMENGGSEEMRGQIRGSGDFAKIEEFEMSRLRRDLLDQTSWKQSKEKGASTADRIGLGKMTDFYRYLKNRNDDRQQARIFRTESTMDKRNEGGREKEGENMVDSPRGGVRHSKFKNMNVKSRIENDKKGSKICASWKLSKVNTEPSLCLKKGVKLGGDKACSGPSVLLERRSILSKSNLRSLLSQNTLGKEDGYFSTQHPKFLKKKNANYQSDYFYPAQEQNMNPNKNFRISVKMGGAMHQFFKTSNIKEKALNVEQKPLMRLNGEMKGEGRPGYEGLEKGMARPVPSAKSSTNFVKQTPREWGSQKSQKCKRSHQNVIRHPIRMRTRSSNPLNAKSVRDSQKEGILEEKIPCYRGFGLRHPAGLSAMENRGLLRSRNQNKLKDKLLSQKIRAGLRRVRKRTPVKLGGSLRRMKERKLMNFEGAGRELDLKQARRFCNSRKSNKLRESGDQKSVLKELLEYIGKE